MIAAATTSSRNNENGLRPVNTRRDMVGLADLLALTFAPTLDAAGRRMIRSMKQFGAMGWPGWLFGHLFLPPAAYPQGFVWTTDGRVIGNASLIEVVGSPGRWVIANVAVHPSFRRKGIASELMKACLAFARRKQGREAVLQVDSDNEGAQTLYRALGFDHMAARVVWTREGIPLERKQTNAPMRARRPEEWIAQWNLARKLYPEGLIWPYPLKKSFFSAYSRFERLGIGGTRHWVWFEGDDLKASLTARWGIDESRWRFVLMLDPDIQAEVEADVLKYGLSALQQGHAPVAIDYPESIGREALLKMRFRPRRTLSWMRRTL